MSSSSTERVVSLLNEASLSIDPSFKLTSLKIVQELLVHSEPELLDNFLDEVMGFQKDRSQDVRKFVVGFIEEGCKKDPDLLPKVIANLQMMMSDSAVAVHKRVIQSMTHLYKVALAWLSKAKVITDDMEAVWNVICSIKEIITGLLEADNDGIRTHTVKFMEMLVITQTHAQNVPGFQGPATNPFSLSDVPLTLKIARRRKLEEEAGMLFDELLKYHGSNHISSANLMTTMGSLTNIAKSRPVFMAKVITALEMLQANLPPTLSKSQVSSVRKHMKTQLLSLLRHPLAVEKHFTNITTLLTDLGATREEVMKVMPKFEEVKRKVRKEKEAAAAAAKAKAAQKSSMSSSGGASVSSGGSKSKKQRLEDAADDSEDDDEDDEEEDDDDDDDDDEKAPSGPSTSSGISQVQVESAVDITERFIKERLTPSLATEIVMSSMHALPLEIPPHFHNTYTPIAAAGTDGQVKHVSRLLATQLTAAQLGPGIDQVRRQKAIQRQSQKRRHPDDEDDDEEMQAASAKISTVIGGATAVDKVSKASEKEKKKAVTLTPAGLNKKSSSRSKQIRLSEMTKPLGPGERHVLMRGAMRRILMAEKTAMVGGVSKVRSKIITALGAQVDRDLKNAVITHLFEDFVAKADLAFSWLFEEFCFFQGFNRTASVLNRRNDDTEYNTILCKMIRGVIKQVEGADRDNLLRRLYLEAPVITDEAIQLLKQFILIEGAAMTVVDLMKDLVMRRPTKKLNCLNFLLEFCSHDVQKVRETAIETVTQLHANGDFTDIIEGYSVLYLRFLLDPKPPGMLFGEDRGRPQPVNAWNEEIIKVCLYLYLGLLPKNLSLFSDIMGLFSKFSADIKRTILRLLDTTARSININNPDLITILENCPEGADTLISRIIMVLTEKTKPSPLLTEKVKEAYETKFKDIRFLIPVLSGLPKREVIEYLPRLISLSTPIVKEVFNRVMSAGGPLSPSDLLIALHNIEPAKCDMKLIIKATTLCFQDKATFSQEVLAIVLEQLRQQLTIPLLFMRTLIQTVSTYPRMVEFAMGILQKLIPKQVWKEPKIWDGFIKCCERCYPQSYKVLLQLPPAQLEFFFRTRPQMRETLLVHVQNFTDAQRAHVPTKTTEVLYNQYVIPDIKAVGPAPEDPMAPPPGDEPGEAGALPARGIKEEMPDSMRPLD